MIKNPVLLLLIAVAFLFVQCNREPLGADPKITNLSDFESNDGAINLNVKGGKAPYTIVWSDESTDTIISNLSAGLYYATITDAKGRIFIDTIEVTQPPYPVCFDSEGNNYKTAIIGEQVWMIDNLKATKNSQGVEIESLVSDDSLFNVDDYGRLYTWNTAMNDSINEGTQGLCPDGWHIPSDKEWFQLTDYATAEGIELSQIFEPQFAGFYNNGYNGLGVSASYWSSTKAKDNAWKRYFHKELSKVFRYHEKQENAISIRCVRD